MILTVQLLCRGAGRVAGAGQGEEEGQASALDAALCGAVAGAVAAAVTTPLDVAKTRLMLGQVTDTPSLCSAPHLSPASQPVYLTPPSPPHPDYCACGCSQDRQGLEYRGVLDTLRRIHSEGGTRLLFAGIGPRVTWISIGGFVFFGAYDYSCRCLSSIFIS